MTTTIRAATTTSTGVPKNSIRSRTKDNSITHTTIKSSTRSITVKRDSTKMDTTMKAIKDTRTSMGPIRTMHTSLTMERRVVIPVESNTPINLNILLKTSPRRAEKCSERYLDISHDFVHNAAIFLHGSSIILLLERSPSTSQ